MADATLIVHKDLSSLSDRDQDLLARARKNQDLAYAPYSSFKVGAALITAQGHIVNGANQENASYPLCMCGERVALYNAAIQYPGERIDTVAIVVSGPKPMPHPAPPCGACLQVVSEFEERQKGPIRLLLKSEGKTIWEASSVRAMLPYAFDGSYLE